MFEHKLRAASILLLLGTGMGRGPRCRFQTEPEGHRVHIPRPKGAGRAVCQNDRRRRSSLPILDLRPGPSPSFSAGSGRRQCTGGLSSRISIQPGQPVAGANAKTRSGFSNPLFVSQERLSIPTGDGQTPRRSGLGLFLHHADIKGGCIGTQRILMRSITPLWDW